MLQDRGRPFSPEARGAMLWGCLARMPAWAFCPMTFTFRSSLGLVSVGRRSTTCRRGQSRTIGPTLSRSPTRSSTCSRRGSAISLMRCSIVPAMARPYHRSYAGHRDLREMQAAILIRADS